MGRHGRDAGDSPVRQKSKKEKKDKKEKKERRERERERHKERDRSRSPRDRERRERDGERDSKRRKASPEENKTVEGASKHAVGSLQDLDAEMEKRRQRVMAWQAARRAKEEEEKAQVEDTSAYADRNVAKDETEGKEGSEAAAEGAKKGWTLEDDAEEEGDVGAGVMDVDGVTDNAVAEGAVDVVPPMNFMHIKKEEEEVTFAVKGVASVAPKEEGVPTEIDEKPAPAAPVEEIDPLDAFMSDFVMPEAEKQIEKAKNEAAAINVASTLDVKPQNGVADMDVDADGGVGKEGGDAAVGVQTQVAAAPVEKQTVEKQKKKRRVKTRYDTSSSEDDSEEEEDEEEMDDQTWAKNAMSGKLSKSDKLAAIDHSQIDYPPFRKNFYIEVSELKRMSQREVADLRAQLDGVKARGKNVPKPIKKFTQCGLSTRVLEILKRSGFESPMPIQAQALPVIMSGRDCIGIAKTGSGKTLAFVLPMLRHIKDQPPLGQNDGPVAMVMAPTRELVQQIGKEVRRFAKAALLTVVNVFGGSGVANQISDLKRGAEVVVCTPGRMIDILATSSGKITNLRRVTYLVLDEADRMFDMGFEPQITRIVQGIRPDRQTVLFSATFPRSVEILARTVLQDPVEVQVGGRSIVNSDIAQFVEIRPEAERFLRLLEVLGEWYERGKILVFVSSQEKCDTLFRDLLKSGYPCLSLHGGKEQTDRECTISDFKSNVCNLLIATSVAARGLDVKELVLVLNYDPPNHHEDYVHRVGRTGRAGAKGTAITFLGPDDDRYAPDVVKALRESKQEIPADLQAMCDSFSKKREAGLAQAHGSGYGGSGFKFDASEDAERTAQRKALRAEYNQNDPDAEDDWDGNEEEEDGDEIRIAGTGPKPEVAPPAASQPGAPGALVTSDGTAQPGSVSAHVLAAQQVAAQISAQAHAQRQSGSIQLTAGARQQESNALAISTPGPSPGAHNPLVAAAQAVAAQIANQVGMPSQSAQATQAARAAAFAAQISAQQHAAMGGPGKHYEAELEINDFPQHSRWKVTHKDSLSQITEITGAAITTRGQFFRAGVQPPPGERKLFLLIEGPTELSVKRAKQEVKRILEEATEKVMRRDAPAGPGRYNVM